MVVRPPPKWKVASSSLATPVSDSRRSCSRAAAVLCSKVKSLSSLSKSSWDKRTFFLSLFLGNAAGLLFFCGDLPGSRQLIETAFPYSISGYYTGDAVALIGFVLGMLVAPALVSATAKRSYARWGLLPLSLFFLWLVLGLASADSSIGVHNVLGTVLLCWVVASCTVSLIRIHRQRRPELRQPLPMALSSRRQSAVFAACLVLVIALVLLGWYNIKHPPPVQNLLSNIKAHWALGKEVRVPLIISDSKIYVKVRLGCREELCLLDTGLNTIEWSRGLHIKGRATGQYSQSSDPVGGAVSTQTVVLPHMRIGGYEIAELPTEMSDANSGLFAGLLSPPPTDADQGFVLGNPAFVTTVLTIDYKNAEMIIRPPQYDFTRQHRKIGERVLGMHWTADVEDKAWEQNLYGYPAIRVAISGVSFWCVVDTGWAGPEIGLTADLVKHHSSLVGHAKQDTVTFGALHSSAQVERLHDLHVTLPCLFPPHLPPVSLRADGLVTPVLYGGEGVIGLALMKRYRITIDYGRRRVLLEPYAPVKSQTMQEKTATKVKRTGI